MPDNNTETKKVKLSEILARYNAGYVRVRPPGAPLRNGKTATGKEPKDAGWQKNPVGLAEALAWAKKGGNVGLVGGVGGLILLDADANADRIEEIEPRLRQTVRILRRNAPERRKWIVHIDGDLPASQKAHGVLEVLSAGTQGVIFGRHHSGAAIEHEGDQIVTLTGDDIRRLWREAVGEDMAQPAPIEAVEPDAEAVKRAMAHVDAVLQHGGLLRTEWRPYEGGVKAILKRCPFNPPDDPHEDDEAAAVLVYADGRIGATCHHARCQERIHAAGVSGWQLLKRLVGYRPDTNPDRARALVAALRQFVRRTDFAEHVPPVLQAVNGYRTRETDMAAADAILDIAHEVGRTEKLIISLRQLRRRTGFGSLDTARKALARLSGWFIVAEEEELRPGDAPRYSIAPHLIAWAEEEITICVDRTPDLPEDDLYDLYRYDLYRSKGCTIYAKSPYVTQRPRDAFTTTLRPMTQEELDARIAARQAEIAAGADVRPLDPRRYRRRLQAAAPGAGRTVLRLIDALDERDGFAEKKELRRLLNLSAAALSRALKRAVELDLVKLTRCSVHLNPAWRELIDVLEPLMPSAGRRIARQIADADAVVRHVQRLLRSSDLPSEREKALLRRLRRAVRLKETLARQARPDLLHRHADVAAPSAYVYHTRKKLAALHAQARIERAEQEHAAAWRLLSEIRRLRSDGVGRRDAWRMLQYAGWSGREVYVAMEALWPKGP